jgi:hypothetical protein
MGGGSERAIHNIASHFGAGAPRIGDGSSVDASQTDRIRYSRMSCGLD